MKCTIIFLKLVTMQNRDFLILYDNLPYYTLLYKLSSSCKYYYKLYKLYKLLGCGCKSVTNGDIIIQAKSTFDFSNIGNHAK